MFSIEMCDQHADWMCLWLMFQIYQTTLCLKWVEIKLTITTKMISSFNGYVLKSGQLPIWRLLVSGTMNSLVSVSTHYTKFIYFERCPGVCNTFHIYISIYLLSGLKVSLVNVNFWCESVEDAGVGVEGQGQYHCQTP